MITLSDKNCLNCASFAWWDGHYCCIPKLKILQESKKGEMNDDILKSLEANKDCPDWKERWSKFHTDMYMEAFNKAFNKNDDEGVRQQKND